MTKITPLQPGYYYHVYNRGNNFENLFIEDRNYIYFLNLYALHIEPIAETFAYCLLRNHFHFLIRVKDEVHNLQAPSRRFSNFFNAYARAFNKAYQRSGALFQRPFGRVEVTDERYFATLVTYIHFNPQKHGFVADFRDWPYSSYHSLLSNKPTRLRRDAIISWFGNIDTYINAHQAGNIIERYELFQEP